MLRGLYRVRNRRFFSTTPTTSGQSSRLTELRARLAAENKTLGDFVDGDVDGPAAPFPLDLSVKRGHEPLPSWLKLKIPKGQNYLAIKQSMKEKKLATVCEEAKCPNIGECWGGGDSEAATATIMMMGEVCTRGCRFCSVKTSRAPPPLDPDEPVKVAAAIKEMGVGYIVITMVDRDDLPDHGAPHVAKAVNIIKSTSDILVETLVGDWTGRTELVEIMANSGVDVYAHNVECVERVTPYVRDRRATYRQSLATLEHAAKARPGLYTKSSIMLGLGEEPDEVMQTLRDLRTAGVSFVTLGQYLQPSRQRMKVVRYAHPDEFAHWQKVATDMGFKYCASGPMVRSSYRAGEFYIKNILQGKAPGSLAAKSAALAEGLIGGSAPLVGATL